jgi:hypothetical protein
VDVRAGDPFVCVWCEAGAHTHCLGPICQCLHSQEGWIPPDRRTALRAGESPRDDRETEYQLAYRSHLEDRRAADQRRT